MKWFGFRVKYIVGQMTGKQQAPMYKHRLVWTKLKNPYLDPIVTPVIAIIHVHKKELPAKLIRFSLYLLVFNAWNWNGFAIVSWTTWLIFIPPNDWITFISMDCSGGFLANVGIILALGILQIVFMSLNFFTKTINKLVNIKARQMIPKIQSFLEIKTF